MSRIAVPDLASSHFKANPYSFWRWLRAEAPVFRAPVGARRSPWLVAGYDNVLTVLQDDRFVKNPASVFTTEEISRQRWVPAVLKPLMRSLLEVDPPDHTRLRTLVHRVFAPACVDRLRIRIEALCDELLDSASGHDVVDVVAEYARPSPMLITAEILGLPLETVNRW